MNPSLEALAARSVLAIRGVVGAGNVTVFVGELKGVKLTDPTYEVGEHW